MGLKLLNDGTMGRKTPREDGRLTNESLSSGYFLQVALAKGGDEGGPSNGTLFQQKPCCAGSLYLFFQLRCFELNSCVSITYGTAQNL